MRLLACMPWLRLPYGVEATSKVSFAPPPTRQLALALRAEVAALQDAGCAIVQVRRQAATC